MTGGRPLLVHLNANSISNKVEEVRGLIAGASIVSLQDHRLPALDRLRALFPGYLVFGHAHDDTGPGSALLVSSGLHHRDVWRHTSGRHRCVGATVRLPSLGGVEVAVASYYAPPNPPAPALDPDLLERCLGASAMAVVLGDLNARHPALGCSGVNSNGVVLRHFLEERSYVPLNDANVATFYHTAYDTADAIDWVVASPAFAALNLCCNVGPDVGSDHLPLLLSKPGRHAPRQRTPPVPRWRLRDADWAVYQRELTRHVTSEPTLWPPRPPETPAELDEAAATIEAALHAAADDSLGRAPPPADPQRGPPLPPEVRWLIQERRRLRRLQARGVTGLRPEINRLRAEVRLATAAARAERLDRVAHRIANGPRDPEFWASVKPWLRPSETRAPPPLRREGDTSVAVSEDERARLFARHLQHTMSNRCEGGPYASFHAEVTSRFASSTALLPLPSLAVPPDAPRLRRPDPPRPEADGASLPDETDPAWLEVPSQAPDSSPPLADDPMVATVSPHALWAICRRLPSNKAPGGDGIRYEMLRRASFPFVACLAALFSSSLALGHIPRRWKSVLARMLPKAGKDLTSCGHYRPISLASSVAKLLERLFAQRLSIFCEERRLLPAAQSAFRPGRNTTEQVALLLQQATKAANLQLPTAVVSLDMARAFDGVWHDGLRETFSRLLPPRTCRWLSSFLSDRQLRVLEGDSLSAPFSPSAGVPQGSPLSPLLFVLYVAGAPLPRGGCTGATVFADDHALWCSAPTLTEAWSRLEPHLDRFVDWCRRWRLELNASKTQLLFISRRLTWRDEDYPTATFLGQPLHRSTTLKLLGVTLDQRLTFAAHARALREALLPRALQLRRLMTNRSIPVRIGLLLYRVYIRTGLTYGAPAMLTSSEAVWAVLERIERAALRASLRVPVSIPNATLQAWSRLPTVRAAYQDASAAFLRWCGRHNNRRILDAIPEPGGVPHRAFVTPPLNAALALLPPSEQLTFAPSL